MLLAIKQLLSMVEKLKKHMVVSSKPHTQSLPGAFGGCCESNT